MRELTKTAMAVIAAIAAMTSAGGESRAADLAQPMPEGVPSMANVDVAFGGTLASQYVARGIAQSDRHAGVQGYGEVRLFDWFYAGAWAASLDLPLNKGLTDPSLEVDAYFGVRHTFDRLTLDAGAIYFWYAGETGANTDYWEPYFTPSYQVTDWLTVGGLLRVTNNFANLGAKEAYLLGKTKIKLPGPASLPDVGFYLSGDAGKRWFGRTDAGVKFSDYYVWNAGLGATYKAMTLDFRYWDTSLSRDRCAFFSGDRGWCGDAYLVSLSFETTLSKLK